MCRLFSGKGEKLKTLDFKTGAGTYVVNTQKGSYNITGDRVETLGMNMYGLHSRVVCLHDIELSLL